MLPAQLPPRTALLLPLALAAGCSVEEQIHPFTEPITTAPPGTSATVTTGGGAGTTSTTAGPGTGGSGGAGGSSGSGGSGGSGGAGGSGGGGGAGPTPITKVFVIVMENRNWSQVKNNPSAPYLNALLGQGAHAEEYKNPPLLHPSEPNYIWMEAGSALGIVNNNPPALNHQSTPLHLVNLLEAAGRSWKSYQEDIAGNVCPLWSVNKYAPKHNPMVFFDDVTEVNNPLAPRCIAHVRPYREIDQDLLTDHVADYSFITPNLCHDGHDGCAPLYDGIAQGDVWLAAEVTKIRSSKAYAEGAVIFITWDEGSGGSDGPIGMIALGHKVKVGYENHIPYTHSSLLRSIQTIFGVGPLLGDAANATDLGDLFTSFP